MKKRNFSFWEYMIEIGKDFEPALAFKGETSEDFEKWQAEAYPKYVELLGRMPSKVVLDAEVVSSEVRDGLVREKVVFDVEEHMSVKCIVLRPENMKADGLNAAILCSHGHGPFGKDVVAGINDTEKMQEVIYKCNYNYGEQMAHAGYITIMPDLRGFGERRDVPYDSPSDFDGIGDGMRYECTECSSNYVRLSVMGIYPLTLNVWDMMRCIDYLETRPEVNPERIGMMGLSQGGTMTTFTTALDKRIKAADIIGYVNPFYDFAIKKYYACGSQVLPGIYKFFDTDEIAGLIAPRPLLLEMGARDDIFPIEDLRKGYEGVAAIYKAAGVEDLLWADFHEGAHQFSGTLAFPFFKKYL